MSEQTQIAILKLRLKTEEAKNALCLQTMKNMRDATGALTEEAGAMTALYASMIPEPTEAQQELLDRYRTQLATWQSLLASFDEFLKALEDE